MPRFGTRSTLVLMSLDERLRNIFYEVIKEFDCSILCGHRGKEEQDYYFHNGLSKRSFPNSKHNVSPSLAIDVAPYPIDWDDERRFYLLAGYVLATANRLHIPLRMGCDWDGDMDLKDQNFHDLPHFEIDT